MTVFVGCPEGCRYHTASAVYDLVCIIIIILSLLLLVCTIIITCVVEIASLMESFGALDIPSLKDTVEKLRLSQRYKLLRSHDEGCQSLWELSSESNANLNSIIVNSTTKTKTSKNLKTGQSDRQLEHVRAHFQFKESS